MQSSAPDLAVAPHPRLRFHTRETLRFGDQDVQGHINNAVYSTLLECSRVAFQSDPSRFAPGSGQVVVVAALSLEFRQELHWPATVEIRLGVSRVGRSSFGFEQEIWLGERLIATARSTQVMIDQSTRKPVPLSAPQRSQLKTWSVDMQIQ